MNDELLNQIRASADRVEQQNVATAEAVEAILEKPIPEVEEESQEIEKEQQQLEQEVDGQLNEVLAGLSTEEVVDPDGEIDN